MYIYIPFFLSLIVFPPETPSLGWPLAPATVAGGGGGRTTPAAPCAPPGTARRAGPRRRRWHGGRRERLPQGTALVSGCGSDCSTPSTAPTHGYAW